MDLYVNFDPARDYIEQYGLRPSMFGARHCLVVWNAAQLELPAATLLNIVIFTGEMDFNTWVQFYISAGYIPLENLHHQGLHILLPLWAPWLFSRY